MTRKSPLGRTTVYDIVESAGDDSEVWTVTGPDGLAAATLFGSNDGKRSTTLPDGTTVAVEQGPDDRFGMASPVPQKMTLSTGGKQLVVETSRKSTLLDPDNALSCTGSSLR